MNNEGSVFILRRHAEKIRYAEPELATILDLAADQIIRTKAVLTDSRYDAIMEVADQLEMMGGKMLETQAWVGIIMLNNAAFVRTLAGVEKNKYGDISDVGC